MYAKVGGKFHFPSIFSRTLGLLSLVESKMMGPTGVLTKVFCFGLMLCAGSENAWLLTSFQPVESRLIKFKWSVLQIESRKTLVNCVEDLFKSTQKSPRIISLSTAQLNA
jgi:hypothetical protein